MDYKDLTALVEKAAAGDEASFDALCRAKINGILLRATQLVGNPHDAEDIAQNVVLKMYQKIGSLRDARLFNAWLQTIIINECNAMHRKRYANDRRILAIEDSAVFEVENRKEFLPAAYAEDKEKQQALLRIIENLPPRRRDVLTMYYFEEMSTAEIAQVTQTSVKTVQNTLIQARKSIEKQLKNQYGDLAAVGSMVGAVPVIKSAYEQYIQSLFPPAAVDSLLEACLSQKTAVALAQTGAAATAAVQHTVASKVIGVVLSAAILIGGTAVVVSHVNKKTAVSSPEGSSPATQPGAPQLDELAGEGLLLPTEGMILVAGQVIPCSHNGVAVDPDGLLLQDIDIVATDAQGRVIGTAQTDAQGAFSMELPAPGDADAYKVSVSPEDGLFVPLRSNGGEATIDAGTWGQPLNLAATVTRTPTGRITAQQGDCACNHVNPARISVSVDVVGISEARWSIANAVGQVVAQGTGDAVSGQLTSLADGDYTIFFFVTDRFGNSAEYRYSFTVDTTTVNYNTYA